MKKIITFAIIFLCLVPVRSLAESSIKAEVDKTTISTDEFFTYKLTVSSIEKRLPQPEIPKFAGFKVVSSSRSSTVSFSKNQAQTVVVYGFVLAPVGTGKFKIEPSSLKIRNQAYTTAAFEIEVIQGKFKPKIEPKREPPLPKGTQPESGPPRITL